MTTQKAKIRITKIDKNADGDVVVTYRVVGPDVNEKRTTVWADEMTDHTYKGIKTGLTDSKSSRPVFMRDQKAIHKFSAFSDRFKKTVEVPDVEASAEVDERSPAPVVAASCQDENDALPWVYQQDTQFVAGTSICVRCGYDHYDCNC